MRLRRRPHRAPRRTAARSRAYSAPFSVGADGTHTVEYRSTDKAGNAETAKSVTVKVDATAPATTAATDGTGPVTLTLTGADATSGVALTEYQVSTAGVFQGFAAPRFAAEEWVPYDGANKPRFTAPGAYTVEYRSTDAAGNVEATKTVAFTIAAPSGDDTLAPVTTGTLDPAQPGPGKTYATPVTVNLSALDPAPAGPPAANHNVDAAGTQWSPTTVNATAGDTVTWRFGPDAGFPHDAWVVPPGGNPDPSGSDITQVTNGLVFPGGPSASKTLNQTGTWTFLCKLHAGFTNGAWSGMVGTAVVTPSTVTNPPSGVDYTEYRVDGGDWVRKANAGGANPFASTLTVSAEGAHTVEYRSADEAGNVETAKSLAFGIDLPDPGFPVIQAFADPSSGAAPLLVRYSATGFDPDGGTLSYKWEFADGVMFGRTVTRTYTADRHVHGQGDGHRRRGQAVGQGRAGRRHRPGRRAAGGVGDLRRLARAGAAARPVHRGGRRGPALRVGLRRRRHVAGPEPRPHLHVPGHLHGEGHGPRRRRRDRDRHRRDRRHNPAGNRAPSVEIAAVPASGRAPLDVLFTAEGTDPDDDELTYTWDFDDGSAAGSGASLSHRYTQAGTYAATVTASDGRGGTDTAEIAIVVGNPAGNQAPTVTAAADPRSGTAPLTVEFSSHAVDADGDDLLVTWAFGDGGQAAGSEATHTYTAAGTYTATVTAMDRHGAAGTRDRADRGRHRAGRAAARGGGRRSGRAVAGGLVRREQPGPDDARRLRLARRVGPGHMHRGDVRNGHADCRERDPQGAQAAVGDAGARHRPLHRRRVAEGDAEAVQDRPARAEREPPDREGNAAGALAHPGEPATQSSRTVTLARR